MQSLQKKKRKIDKDLIRALKEFPCVVCGNPEVDIDHIEPVGRGGNDDISNLWQLCRECHTKKHQDGLTTFVSKFYFLRSILESKGFYWGEINKKWMKSKRRGLN